MFVMEKLGHTETIKIDYDKSIISYKELLEIFFLLMIQLHLTDKVMI